MSTEHLEIPSDQRNLSFELRFQPGYLNYFIWNIYVKTRSPDYSVPLGRVLSYLNWWDLAILDLATFPYQYADLRRVLSTIWVHDKFGIYEIPRPPSNSRFYYYAQTLPYFEPFKQLLSIHGLPVCQYLAGIINRVKDLIPGYSFFNEPIESLVSTLHSLILFPNLLGNSISESVKSAFTDLHYGVKYDQEFRKAIVTERT